MKRLFSVTLLLLLLVVTLGAASRRSKNHKGKHEKPASDCSTAETRYGKCVPKHGDCGDGRREVTCKDHTSEMNCRIPCNWKKQIGDCRYKFEPWGNCDAATNTKSRSGTLKRALFNAKCQTTFKVSKPCSHKAKTSRGEKRLN